MLQFESKGYPIKEQDISKFENFINSRLPNEYRNFLLEYNVCKIDPDGFTILINDTNDESRIQYFLGLNVNRRKEYYYSLEWYYELMQNRIPRHFLQIASDPLGNAILIHLNDGSIWFWDHELEAEIDTGNDYSVDNIFLISKNFNNFLNSLHKIKIDNS